MKKEVENGLRRGIGILRDGGCSVICIPCNTAHTWYEHMVDEAGPGVEVLHMINLAS